MVRRSSLSMRRWCISPLSSWKISAVTAFVGMTTVFAAAAPLFTMGTAPVCVPRARRSRSPIGGPPSQQAPQEAALCGRGGGRGAAVDDGGQVGDVLGQTRARRGLVQQHATV